MIAAALAGAGVGLRTLRTLLPNPEWGDARVRVLFLGSSHVDGGITPARMPVPAARITHAGAEIDLLARAYLSHRDRWPRLQVVLIEVDEVTLLGDRAWNHRFDLTPLAGDLDLDPWELPRKDDPIPRAVWIVRNLLRGRGLAGLDPSRRFTLANLERRLQPTPDEWIQDRSPPPAPARTSTLSRSLSERGVEYLRQTAADPRFNVAALIELTRALRARGIDVILLTLPDHRFYRAVRPEAWQRLVESTVESVRAAAGEPIPHWDYRADDRFSDDDFNNATHLDPRGAARFTDLIAERLASRARQ